MSIAIAEQEPRPHDRSGGGHTVDLEACAKRVRVEFGGEIIADSTDVVLVRETGHVAVYYFPVDDVRMDRLTRTAHGTDCPFKGTASYWSVTAGGRTAENAVWGYEAPLAEVGGLKDHVAFYWDLMDHWYEEDEEVFVHARDPHVRVDVVASARRVTVTLGGEVVADSRRALFLFETGLPVRYYLPKDDVRMALLTATDTRTACPYKGEAVYWSAEVGGTGYDDIVWSYPDPLPEVGRIKDYVAFYNERVDGIAVGDGSD